MQEVNIKTNQAFAEVAANTNIKCRMRAAHKQHMLAAYGLGSRNNGWSDYKATFKDDYFSVSTYFKNGKPHKAITVFRIPARDNNGYTFSVYRYGRHAIFRTNNLQHALGNFKSVDPELRLIYTHARPQ